MVKDPARAAEIQRIADEGGGVIDIYILAAADGPRLCAASLAGDRHATMLLRSVEWTFQRISDIGSQRCMVCPAMITEPRGISVVFLTADLDLANRTAAVGGIVCPSCAQLPDLFDRVRGVVSELWGRPCLPLGAVTHEAGRA